MLSPSVEAYVSSVSKRPPLLHIMYDLYLFNNEINAVNECKESWRLLSDIDREF